MYSHRPIVGVWVDDVIGADTGNVRAERPASPDFLHHSRAEQQTEKCCIWTICQDFSLIPYNNSDLYASSKYQKCLQS